MCVYLFAPSRGQPLCFSLWINNSATLGKIKTFKINTLPFHSALTTKLIIKSNIPHLTPIPFPKPPQLHFNWSYTENFFCFIKLQKMFVYRILALTWCRNSWTGSARHSLRITVLGLFLSFFFSKKNKTNNSSKNFDGKFKPLKKETNNYLLYYFVNYLLL